MPSLPHEAPLEVLRAEPALAPLLLRELLGVDVPAYASAETSDSDFSQIIPAEFRADLVIVLRAAPPDPVPIMTIVIEVQRRRDDAKRRSWPLYAAALHARVRTPTCLLVIATDESTARWAATPITTLQPGSPFQPLVLGPERVPRLSGERARRQPHLAVLSALVHGNGPGGVAIALAALDAVSELSDERATLFFDLICASLDDEHRSALEAEMEPGKYEYRSDFARRYFGEGREEGREEGRLTSLRAALLALAQRRWPGVPDHVRARITACPDADRLMALVVEVGAAPDAQAVERLLESL